MQMRRGGVAGISSLPQYCAFLYGCAVFHQTTCERTFLHVGIKRHHIAMPNIKMVASAAIIKGAPKFSFLFIHSRLRTVGFPIVGNVVFKMEYGPVCHRPNGFSPNAKVFVFASVL